MLVAKALRPDVTDASITTYAPRVDQLPLFPLFPGDKLINLIIGLYINPCNKDSVNSVTKGGMSLSPNIRSFLTPAHMPLG